MTDVKHVLNGVKSVVLDLDGTMYDKGGLARRIALRLCWCLPLVAIDRLARGRCWRWLVRTRWYRRVYMPLMVSLIGRTCKPRTETMALVDECRRRQIPMAVYSDYLFIREKLRVLGIDDTLFAVCVDSPALGLKKPSRKAVLRVLEMLHADPQTTLFVGDRDDTDGESARLIGAKFLLIS